MGVTGYRYGFYRIQIRVLQDTDMGVTGYRYGFYMIQKLNVNAVVSFPTQ